MRTVGLWTWKTFVCMVCHHGVTTSCAFLTDLREQYNQIERFQQEMMSNFQDEATQQGMYALMQRAATGQRLLAHKIRIWEKIHDLELPQVRSSPIHVASSPVSQVLTQILRACVSVAACHAHRLPPRARHSGEVLQAAEDVLSGRLGGGTAESGTLHHAHDLLHSTACRPSRSSSSGDPSIRSPT